MYAIFVFVFSAALSFAAIFLSSCGGGGFGFPIPPIFTGSTAAVEGYVYEYNPAKAADPLIGAQDGYVPIPAVASIGGTSDVCDDSGYFRISSVQPGAAQLTISLPGFVTETRTVALPAGQVTTVSGKGSTALILKRTSRGTLILATNPPGADIMINGVATGKRTPYTFPDLPAGSYQITLRLDGYEADTRDVVLSNGLTLSREINLVPIGSPDGGLADPADGEDILDLQKPTSYDGPAVAPPTQDELAALLQNDAELARVAINQGDIRIYESVVEAMCGLYNEDVITSTFFGAIPGVPAQYRGFQGTPVTGKIDVYYSGYDPDLPDNVQARLFNAFASYEAAFYYENLFLAMDEDIALMFLSETADEWIDWVSEAQEAQVAGYPFSYVSPELRDDIVADPELGPEYIDLLSSCLGVIISHELGHVNLGHILQSKRLAGYNLTPDDVINGTRLDWQFEWQADIYSAHAMRLIPQETDRTGVLNTDGGAYLRDMGNGPADLHFRKRPSAGDNAGVHLRRRGERGEPGGEPGTAGDRSQAFGRAFGNRHGVRSARQRHSAGNRSRIRRTASG